MAKWRHPSTVSFHASESWAGNLDGSSCSDAREWKEAQKERPRQRAGALTTLLKGRLEASRVARPTEPRDPCAPALGTSERARLESTVLGQPSPLCGGIRPSARYPTRRYDPLAPVSRRQIKAWPVPMAGGRRPRVRLKKMQHWWNTESVAAEDTASEHAGQALFSACCANGIGVAQLGSRGNPTSCNCPWFRVRNPAVGALMGQLRCPSTCLYGSRVPDFGGTGIHPLAQELWRQNSHPLPLFPVYSRRLVNAVCALFCSVTTSSLFVYPPRRRPYGRLSDGHVDVISVGRWRARRQAYGFRV